MSMTLIHNDKGRGDAEDFKKAHDHVDNFFHSPFLPTSDRREQLV